jgi:RNA polymerase sigma factor (sigma-70 family)
MGGISRLCGDPPFTAENVTMALRTAKAMPCHRTSQTTFDDVRADAMVGLWRAWRTFDGSRAGFSTWLGRCVKGEVLDGYRRRDKSVRAAGRNVSSPTFSRLAHTKNLAANAEQDHGEAAESVTRLLAPLAKRERAIAYLHLACGMNMPEVGRMLGISQSRVCQLVPTIKAKLRALYGAH